MDKPYLEKLLQVVDSTTSTQYRNETVEIFKQVFAAIKTLRDTNQANSLAIANRLENSLQQFEAGFKQRLGATNADLGNKASKQQIESLESSLDTFRKEVYGLIEEAYEAIPEVKELTGDEIIEKVSRINRQWIPIEVIKGSENLISRGEVEDAIVEIGGKLTVLEKRNAKGYGALGGGSEGTGSLFLSRLRDVDVTGLTKNSDGKYVLGSGSGTGGTTYIQAGTNVIVTGSGTFADPYIINASSETLQFETPVGAVDDSNTTFTVTNEPTYIIVNGAQYREGQGQYQSYSAGTITLAFPVGSGGFIDSAYTS